MAPEWHEVPFQRLLTEPVRNGIYKRKEFHGRGAKIVNMGELFGHPRLRAVPMKRVELTEDEVERFTIARGDLLFARRSLVAEGAGKCSVVLDVDEPTTFESSIIRARPDTSKADPIFLYYFFSSGVGLHRLDTIRRQVAVAGITGTDLSRLEISVPSLAEQHTIAHILGALDDKIELNRRMSETLEAMARALFKSWFVDFDPVRAKAEGRNSGLPKHLADLFPARLVDSELGEIAEGWRYRELGELVHITRGRTYQSGLKGLPGPVLLGLASIERNGGFRDDKLSTYGGECPAELLVGPGELFASLKDVTQSADLLGAVARVPTYIDRGRLTQDTVKLDFRSTSVSKEIVYRSLLTPAYRDYCHSRATGTTNLGLSRDDFLSYPILQPTEGVQRAFDSVVENAEARSARATAQSRTLAALRDALLPRLISGDVRVPDAEKFLEGAVS